ncbi:endonuclease domain-containing protein [Streptomyces sp. NPDC003027]
MDWKVRARAVQLRRPGWVCSHRTAAALHRVEVLNGGALNGGVLNRGGAEGEEGEEGRVLEFTMLRRGGCGASARAGLRVHTTVLLTERDVSVRAGLRVTTPARTVGDLMRCGSREEGVVVADSALSRRTVRGVRREPLVRPDDLATQLSRRLPGAPRARAMLPLTDPAAGSPAETIARLRMRDAGLHPESQPLLHTASGRPLRPDFLFREAGLVVEIEGYAFHGTRHAHARDIDRFNALAECPSVRRILRFTATEVFHHPDRMIARIRAVLAT